MFIVRIIIVIYIYILCTNTKGNTGDMIDDFAEADDPFVEGMLRYCICYYKFDKYHCIMNTLRDMKQDQRKVAYLSLR